MKFEEVLPAFQAGKKIRRKDWEPHRYICLKDEDSLLIYHILKNDWEIIEEPEPDWQYIIKNKCLCWFWDSNFNWAMCGTLGQIEKGVEYEFTMFDEAGNRSAFKHCRPVRKEEVKFYEDKEDEDS